MTKNSWKWWWPISINHLFFVVGSRDPLELDEVGEPDFVWQDSFDRDTEIKV